MHALRGRSTAAKCLRNPTGWWGFYCRLNQVKQVCKLVRVRAARLIAAAIAAMVARLDHTVVYVAIDGGVSRVRPLIPSPRAGPEMADQKNARTPTSSHSSHRVGTEQRWTWLYVVCDGRALRGLHGAQSEPR